MASLWQVIILRAYGCRVSMWLDSEAEDGGDHDDGGVSLAMGSGVIAAAISTDSTGASSLDLDEVVSWLPSHSIVPRQLGGPAAQGLKHAY